jgi:uncharacterized membrane protein YozB (DUF420 family)
MLAMKYREISRSVPALFEERDEETDSVAKKRWLTTLKVSSYVSGPIKGLATFWLRNMEWLQSQHPKPWQATLITIAADLGNICNFVSGIILITSVGAIRRFFVEHGSDQMDIAAMLRHAICFVLYLAATVIFMISYNISVFNKTPKYSILFQWSTVVFYTISFVSNIMLAYIFYDVFRD